MRGLDFPYKKRAQISVQIVKIRLNSNFPWSQVRPSDLQSGPSDVAEKYFCNRRSFSGRPTSISDGPTWFFSVALFWPSLFHTNSDLDVSNIKIDRLDEPSRPM